MIVHILLLLLGLALLIFSADKFVDGASALARKLGLSPLLIGLTIVAMGSSAPEMFVAAQASLANQPDTAIGNVLGSNIANICLILGISAIYKTINVQSLTIKREIPIMLLATFIAGYFLVDGHLNQLEGIILLLVFFTIMGWLIFKELQDAKRGLHDSLEDEMAAELPNLTTPMALFWLLFGIVLLPLSSELMVEHASIIAKALGMSDLVIGLTIIAVGTSLPELAATIASLSKGEDSLAVGNVVGSNLFNILAVLSIPALIAPGQIDSLAAGRDNYVTLSVSILMFLLIVVGKKSYNLKPLQGVILLACFVGYQSWLLSTSISY